MVSAAYDLFVSYTRRDSEHVVPIVTSLRAEGLRVWFDQTDVADFASITRSIREGLACSKALLAYYSAEYPRRHACQWELTAAFIAAQQEGDVQRRVIIINPESGVDHIDPIELRDARFAVPPSGGDHTGMKALGRRVADHVQAIETPLSDIRPLDKPRWFPNEGTRYRHFVGRTRELWRIHSHLHARDSAAIVESGISGIGQITGLGGIGKSLLAEEYALRFGAAYPGGVFWLRGYGNHETEVTLSSADHENSRADQFQEFASKLGVAVKGLDPSEIEGALALEIERRGLPCLWVVDDVPSGLSHESLRKWCAPHPLARTLFTTRSQDYINFGEPLRLGKLPKDEARELLVSRRSPKTLQEEEAAQGILQALDGHALAIDVAAAALKRSEGVFTFQEFRSRLAEPDKDVLDFAAELANDLPNGHQKDIAGTLFHSLRLLGPEGWDFMRLASVLSVHPISPVFMGVVFTLADGVEPEAAQNRALRAARDAEDLSLADMLEGGLRAVHPLVSRAVRFRDAEPIRTRNLRAAAVQIIVILLSGTASEFRLHAGVELEVAHARKLAKVLCDEADFRLVRHLAQHDYVRSDYPSAVQLLRQCAEYCERTLGSDHSDTLACKAALDAVLERAGDPADALTLSEEVLAKREPELGREHPHTLDLLNNLAMNAAAAGDLDRAYRLHLEVLRARERVFGRTHRDTLISKNNVAEVLRRGGDLAIARKLLEEVLETLRQTVGESHADTLVPMDNLGLVLQAQGELEEARALQEKSLDLHRRLLPRDHPSVAGSMINLADTLGAQGHSGDARTLQEEALELYKRLLPRAHPSRSVAAWNLLQTLRQLHDSEAIRKVFEDELLWLRDQTTETLDWQQRQICEWLTMMDIEKTPKRRGMGST